MALNFRLQANAGNDNDTLFPRTGVSGVIGATHSYEIVIVDVTIPATQEDVQTIAISADTKMANSTVRMYLKSTDGTSSKDYSTITQFEVKENQLVIDRLYSKPQNSIEVQLVFFERRS